MYLACFECKISPSLSHVGLLFQILKRWPLLKYSEPLPLLVKAPTTIWSVRAETLSYFVTPPMIIRGLWLASSTLHKTAQLVLAGRDIWIPIIMPTLYQLLISYHFN
jgi:hypothetical protein